MARPTLAAHPKFIRLAMAVGERAAALGSLELIWDTIRVSKTIGDSFAVEAVCDWRGSPGLLTAALAESGAIALRGKVFIVNRNCSLRRARMMRSDYGPNWRSIKELILARDGGTCVRCGADDRLEVHHRTPLVSFDGDLEAANSPRNLETLCRLCHRRADNELRALQKKGSV